MTTHQEEQVNRLNEIVKARIMPSKIHGVGVFALRDLKKGQKIYSDIVPSVFDLSYGNFNKLWPEVKQLILERFPQIINGSKFVWPTERLQGFMNHSDSPNYDALSDEVMRDVKKGEEITEDYKQIPNFDKVFPFLK